VNRTDCDIVIIGAGVAGLAAAATLSRAGKDVRCLEATDRIGGRILTVHDPLAPLAIELGAEFVHGRPPETWDLIRTIGLTAYEHTSHALHIHRGRILNEKEVGEMADRVLSRLAKSVKRKDESFEEFLRRSHQRPEIKNWARLHIEGFNAARKELISAASLKQDAEAAEEIEGDRTFRIPGGYDSIALALLRSSPDHHAIVQLNSIVERVVWRRGLVEVRYRSALDNEKAKLRCRQLIVTVPLGVLQAAPLSLGAIHFDPQPREIIKAAEALAFGQVYRITFRFRHAFWDEDERLKRVGFLLSKEKLFPTWWTTHPIDSPLLTGWTAGSAADPLRSADQSALVTEALRSLARILNRKVPRPEAIYFHDWHADPFFRGAYSYVPVNALAARKALSKAVDDTLFFAGEATETNGHGSTVHGAIASGVRVAAQIQSANSA
jgi:monoamine oxidase